MSQFAINEPYFSDLITINADQVWRYLDNEGDRFGVQKVFDAAMIVGINDRDRSSQYFTSAFEKDNSLRQVLNYDKFLEYPSIETFHHLQAYNLINENKINNLFEALVKQVNEGPDKNYYPSMLPEAEHSKNMISVPVKALKITLIEKMLLHVTKIEDKIASQKILPFLKKSSQRKLRNLL